MCLLVTVSLSLCGSLRVSASITNEVLLASRWHCAPPLQRSSILTAPGCHHWRGLCMHTELASLTPQWARATWISWGISLVFQLSSQGSDATVCKLWFNPCLWYYVCSAPSWTPQESLSPGSCRAQGLK